MANRAEVSRQTVPEAPLDRCASAGADGAGMMLVGWAFRAFRMRPRRRMVWMAALALAGGGLAAALATLRISAVAAPFVKTAAADLPAVRVGLVLGCSPTMSDGRSNSFFARRIAAAAELYRARRVQFLLLSGDHSRPDYDEPSEMRRALIRAGVPASRLVLDYAGFRTLDSVVRAKDVFGLRQVIIVSQHFHNERAVYLARAHGLEAFAFDAVGVGGPEGLRMAAREAVSRVFAVLDARVFHTRPRFDGPPETAGASLLRADGELVEF